MKRWINCAVVVAFGFGIASLGLAQNAVEAESKFMAIGEVSKIDLKDKSITINDATLYNIAELANAGGAPVGGRGGAGRMPGGVNVRGGGGGGRRGGGGGGASPATGRTASAPIPMEYRVIVSAKTHIGEGDHAIKIEDLKIGDHLQVYSMKGGSKLDAVAIVRTPKD